VGRIALHPNAKGPAKANHVTEIASNLRWINLDGANALQSGTRGNLAGDRHAYGTKPEMHDPNRHPSGL
jgi:hypothetical protein